MFAFPGKMAELLGKFPGVVDYHGRIGMYYSHLHSDLHILLLLQDQ
jgi:hypothetical protein